MVAALCNLGRGAGMLLVTALLVSLLSLSVFASTVVQHTVRPGESVTSIARKYGVSNSQILADNNIANANLLRVGQILSITVPDDAPAPTPVPTSTAAPTSAPAADDTQSAPTASKEDAQDNAQPTPVATAVPPAPVATPRPASGGCNRASQAGDLRYTIRSGDSLYGLASRYSVTVGAIKSRNCLTSDVVLVGQLIIIPMGVINQNPGPAPTATGRPADDQPATATPTPWPTATPRPAPTRTPVPEPTPDTRSWLDRLLNR